MTTTSVPYRWTYDVFISFRGEDIRKSFVDHLFKDFKQKGIHAFRDDNEFPRGEEICTQLYKAIEDSRFLIVIFSKHYASSSWCLKELVKILNSKQMGNPKHDVRIIFYDVKPDMVRKQTGIYADAFVKYEQENRIEVLDWKKALSVAANLSGWDLEDTANGYESKLIDSISKDILQELCNEPLHVGENLVGVDAHVKKMNLFRFIGSNKVHMIGICGIGGIGKTTLAKAIYNLMYIHFEECIFLEDVQGVSSKHGLSYVLRQLLDNLFKTGGITVTNVSQGTTVMRHMLSSKRILLVLDAVDHLNQLEALAGSPDWFFPGSLIIFTGKDRQLLKSHKVDPVYDMGYLDYGEALELFSLHAFDEKYPTEDFKELTNQVLDYVQGHPLALKVLGCFLYDKPISVWKSELDRHQLYPHTDILQVLRLSFFGLDHDQRRIFLDIASSLIGVHIDLATSVLDSCNFFAETNIRILVDKALITISSTKLLQMHELIQAMARQIVHEESNWPGDRSRLWIPSEVCDVLNKAKVTEAIEVFVLLLEKSNQKVNIDCNCFAIMNNLRILKVCDLECENFGQTFESKLPKDSKVNYSGCLNFLSNDLRLLYWHKYPFKFLPSNFYPENIVAIDMSYSHIKKIWTTPKCFRRLKVMKLSHCRNLTTTPDFTEITNLEELILEGCVNLVTIHPSIRILNRLVVLNIRNCNRLRRFPIKVEMGSLKVLIVSGCLKVKKLLEVFGTIGTLVELHVDQRAITEFPYLFYTLTNLQVLSVGRKKGDESRLRASIFWPSYLKTKLQRPKSLVLSYLASLKFLKRLNVSDCDISEVSPDIGGLSCLEALKMCRNKFTCLPESLSQLSRLEHLILDECKKLEELPELPQSIISFHASYCTSLGKLGNLLVKHHSVRQHMCLMGCPKLVKNLESLASTPSAQGLNYLSQKLDVLFYENRIPQWFTKRRVGNRIKVELPQGWCYNKFMGYETFVVFMAKKSYGSKGNYVQPGYSVNNLDKTLLNDVIVRPIHVTHNIMSMNIGSYVTWLHYSTRNPSWIEAKNFVTFSFRGFANIEVKECGVRIICQEDIKEEKSLNMMQGLFNPTQDGDVFHLDQEWSSATVGDEFSHCTRHIVWSSN